MTWPLLDASGANDDELVTELARIRLLRLIRGVLRNDLDDKACRSLQAIRIIAVRNSTCKPTHAAAGIALTVFSSPTQTSPIVESTAARLHGIR